MCQVPRLLKVYGVTCVIWPRFAMYLRFPWIWKPQLRWLKFVIKSRNFIKCYERRFPDSGQVREVFWFIQITRRQQSSTNNNETIFFFLINWSESRFNLQRKRRLSLETSDFELDRRQDGGAVRSLELVGGQREEIERSWGGRSSSLMLLSAQRP